MKKAEVTPARAAAEPDAQSKKPYRSPVLRKFGSLHRMTQSTIAILGDAASNMMDMSDRATKENIVRIGDHPLGIGLYLFDYKREYRAASGHGRQFGVMADEVATVMPQAVSIRPDGHKQVNYAMLGFSRAA